MCNHRLFSTEVGRYLINVTVVSNEVVILCEDIRPVKASQALMPPFAAKHARVRRKAAHSISKECLTRPFVLIAVLTK